MVNENLKEAIEHIETARDNAPLGTEMMLDEILNDLQRVQQTYDENSE